MTLHEPERVGVHGKKTWLNLDVLCRRLRSTTYPEGLPEVVSESSFVSQLPVSWCRW